MFRFVHTADWQMGMMARGLGPAAEAVRAARVAAIERALTAAGDFGAEAILVAGDLFEDNQVSNQVLEQVLAALNDRTRIPIYIIPGNHDPYTRDSVYRRPQWRQLRGHVRVLTTCEPVMMAEGVQLLPCPLDRKHGMDDPSAGIPRREGSEVSGGIRVGLVHGTMRILPGVGDDDFPIGLEACAARGLDYLALGHWHSTLGHPIGDPHGRAWYSGTHETTKFGERDSGNVLRVTLDRPGAAPRVEAVRTGALKWLDQGYDLEALGLAEAMRRLRELPDPRNTLLRVRLAGRRRAEDAGGLAELIVLIKERFLYASLDDTGLRPAADDQSLEALLGAPYLRDTAALLKEIAEGRPRGALNAPPEVARRALDLLHEVAWEQRGG